MKIFRVPWCKISKLLGRGLWAVFLIIFTVWYYIIDAWSSGESAKFDSRVHVYLKQIVKRFAWPSWLVRKSHISNELEVQVRALQGAFSFSFGFAWPLFRAAEMNVMSGSTGMFRSRRRHDNHVSEQSLRRPGDSSGASPTRRGNVRLWNSRRLRRHTRHVTGKITTRASANNLNMPVHLVPVRLASRIYRDLQKGMTKRYAKIFWTRR